MPTIKLSSDQQEIFKRMAIERFAIGPGAESWIDHLNKEINKRIQSRGTINHDPDDPFARIVFAAVVGALDLGKVSQKLKAIVKTESFSLIEKLRERLKADDCSDEDLKKCLVAVIFTSDVVHKKYVEWAQTVAKSIAELADNVEPGWASNRSTAEIRESIDSFAAGPWWIAWVLDPDDIASDKLFTQITGLSFQTVKSSDKAANQLEELKKVLCGESNSSGASSEKKQRI